MIIGASALQDNAVSQLGSMLRFIGKQTEHNFAGLAGSIG